MLRTVKIVDGRKHPEDPDPTWYGHSVGHDEGNSLVVDTVGGNDKVWFDFRGHPRSEKLYTLERYTRMDMGSGSLVETTITDPVYCRSPSSCCFATTIGPPDGSVEFPDSTGSIRQLVRRISYINRSSHRVG